MKHQIRDYESSWFQLLILSPFSPCSPFPCSGLTTHSCMLNHFLQALLSVIYGRFLPGRREETRPPLAQVNHTGVLCAASLEHSGTQVLGTASLREPWQEASPICILSLQIHRGKKQKKAGKRDNSAWICSVCTCFPSHAFKGAHLFIFKRTGWICINLTLRCIKVYSFEYVFK